MKTRAEFLRLAAIAATAAVVAPRMISGRGAVANAAAGAPQEPGVSPDRLRDQLGKDPVFWILDDNGRRKAKLLLEKVVDRDSDLTEQFTFKFACPGGTRLPDATYALDHGALGRISLYLAALPATPGDPAGYRAEFNLLKSA